MILQREVEIKWKHSILLSNEEQTSCHNCPLVDGPLRCQCGIWTVAAPCRKEHTQASLQKWRTKHSFLHSKRNADAEFWAHLTTNTEQDTTESVFTSFPQIIAWNAPPAIQKTRVWKSFHVLCIKTINIFTGSHSDFWAHQSTSTECDTTESIFTCFPQMIAWNTSPGIQVSDFCTIFCVHIVATDTFPVQLFSLTLSAFLQLDNNSNCKTWLGSGWIRVRLFYSRIFIQKLNSSILGVLKLGSDHCLRFRDVRIACVREFTSSHPHRSCFPSHFPRNVVLISRMGLSKSALR
jgi:hypothetical protein